MSPFGFVVVAVLLHYVLTGTRTGNRIPAVGGNAKPAAARGVKVARVKVGLFLLSAAVSGFAGVISPMRWRRA